MLTGRKHPTRQILQNICSVGMICWKILFYYKVLKKLSWKFLYVLVHLASPGRFKCVLVLPFLVLLESLVGFNKRIMPSITGIAEYAVKDYAIFRYSGISLSRLPSISNFSLSRTEISVP